MILSGLSVVRYKLLKAAGFADITEMGFINETWVESELRLPGSCSRTTRKEKKSSHTP